MKSNLEYFFKTTYDEDGVLIVEFGAESNLQKLRQQVYIETGEWMSFTEPIDQFEYGSNLVDFFCVLSSFTIRNPNISIYPKRLGDVLCTQHLPEGETEAFFLVRKHVFQNDPSQISFFIRGKEEEGKTKVLVYIPFDEGHLDLWDKIRSTISGQTVAPTRF